MTVPQDMHTFLDQYQRANTDDVVRLPRGVGTDEDATAIVYELTNASRDEMVVCDNVDGLDTRLITNAFASRRRIARWLGTEPERLHETFQARARQATEPRERSSGPLLDTVETGTAVKTGNIPMVRHFASDAGPYITSGIIVAEDPVTGSGNLSYHRAMRHSETELATSLHSRGHLWRMLSDAGVRGERLPVAMVLGGHPLFMLAASARVPYGFDERAIAGGLLGAPLEVVRTPKYGIRVPASADIVLEGTIDAEATVKEGPFGEFSGYSSNRSTNSLFEVQTMMRRHDPWLLDVVGGNTADHLNLARIPRESEMAEQLKDRFPDVTALHYPTSGTHFHAYVSMAQRWQGQARQVLLGLLGWDPYLKTAIAVDSDVDATSDSEVLWAMATHAQPNRDVYMVDGLPGSPLDPSSSVSGTTSRMAIDATRPPDFEGERIVLSHGARTRARSLLSQKH